VQSGEWAVVKGELTFTGGSGICGATLYYKRGGDWTGYEFQVDMKLTNLMDWPGGIRVRLNPNTGESYFTWVYPEIEQEIMVYVATGWDCNADEGIAQKVAWPVPAVDEWNQLKMVVAGDLIESWWNDELLLSIEDDTWEAGMIGFTTFNQDVVFDNVSVTGPGIPQVVEPQGKLAATWAAIRNARD
jgi:hypothetical protein